MKTLLKTVALPLLGAAVALAGSSELALAKSAPAAAPAAGAVGVNGIAVANMDAVMLGSAAYKAAGPQRETTYKATIDAAKAKRAALEAQLRPLADKFEKDRAANAPQASLQQQYNTIQQLEANGNQELQKIMEPLQVSEMYVREQIEDKIGDAVKAAMTKNSVSLVLRYPTAVVLASSEAYNLTPAIVNELNALLPSVSVQPPAGWQPREAREQQAAQAGARGTAGEGR